jgi:shikimate kinase
MRVLITGMSGAGKSSVVAELAARGHEAHDLDTPEWSEWIEAPPGDGLTPQPGADWVWREERVRELLSRPREAPVFIAGTAENMGRMLDLIDEVVLLTAPNDTLMQRLADRPAGRYGSSEDDRRNARALNAVVEPRLRSLAGHEIDTRRAAGATAEAVLDAVLGPRP